MTYEQKLIYNTIDSHAAPQQTHRANKKNATNINKKRLKNDPTKSGGLSRNFKLHKKAAFHSYTGFSRVFTHKMWGPHNAPASIIIMSYNN